MVNHPREEECTKLITRIESGLTVGKHRYMEMKNLLNTLFVLELRGWKVRKDIENVRAHIRGIKTLITLLAGRIAHFERLQWVIVLLPTAPFELERELV